jgi:hypothetical protein
VLKAFRYATGMRLAVYLKRVKVSPKTAHTEGVMDTLPKNSRVVRCKVTEGVDLQMASSDGVSWEISSTEHLI